MTAVLRAGPCAGLCAVSALPRRMGPCFRPCVSAAAPATTTTAPGSFRCPFSSSHACSSARTCFPKGWRSLPSLPASYSPSRRLLFTSSPPVITSYLDLPPDYDDAKGLPFRQRRRRLGSSSSSSNGRDDSAADDLDAAEVTTIFGRTALAPPAASRLLRILHGRRVAGTLDDPAYRAATVRYTPKEIAAALTYLRRTVPVEEVINAGLRAEDELAAMEEEGEEQGVDLGEVPAAKDTLPATPGSKWRARLFREAPDGDVYGVGALDTIRARNLAKNAERERARQAAEAAQQEAQERAWAEQAASGGARDVVAAGDGGRGTALTTPRTMSPRMQQWAVAATSMLEAPPEMSRWQRLGPSYVFALALVAGGAALAGLFPGDEPTTASGLPPPPSSPADASAAPAASPAATATVLGLIGVNVAVFVLWRVPPLWRLMNRYMLVVPATPRPLSLLGAVFSHQAPGHLAANMAFLYFIGLRLHDEVGGRAAFLDVYVSAGVLAFLASLTHLVLRPGQLHLTTLGASGAIYGIAAAYFVLHKYDGFKILGLPPDPYHGVQGLGFVGLMLVVNLLALRAEHHKRSIDLVTHFVGIAVGAAFGEYHYRRRADAAQAAIEDRPPRSGWALLVSSLTTAPKPSSGQQDA